MRTERIELTDTNIEFVNGGYSENTSDNTVQSGDSDYTPASKKKVVSVRKIPSVG